MASATPRMKITKSLHELNKELINLEANAVAKFMHGLSRKRKLLGGNTAHLQSSLLTGAKWQQELAGLECWDSHLRPNNAFSYFAYLPPQTGGVIQKWLEKGRFGGGMTEDDVSEGSDFDESENEKNGRSSDDYCD